MATKKRTAKNKSTGQTSLNFGATKKKSTAKAPKLTAKMKKQGITATLLKKAAQKGGIAIKESKRQSGSSNLIYDAKRSAKAPGKRLSRTGRIYYESRANRSDL